MLRELYTYLKEIHMKLQDKLSYIDQSKLILCSDEEFSTCKAIWHMFPTNYKSPLRETFEG